MNQQFIVKILAQTGDDYPVSEGLSGHGPHMVAIDNQYSFFGLAEDLTDADGTVARVALEILLDDVQTNLGSREFEQATEYEKHVLGSRCIEESFENINDYLMDQEFAQSGDAQHKGVAMSVMQVLHGQCSFVHAAEHCCILFRDGQLKFLNRAQDSADKVNTRLGVTQALNIQINQIALAAKDILLICNWQLLHYVDEEFLRVTLARFEDTPDMAIRQINSRSSRAGMQQKPLLALVTLSAGAEKSKGWFHR
jgi:hypothetical protein